MCFMSKNHTGILHLHTNHGDLLMREAVRKIYYILFDFMYQGQLCNFLIFWNRLCPLGLTLVLF